jgi:uncharacterized membrane protein YphA (DoxX/SURF4 family)
MRFNKTNAWELILLLVRIWLGFRMIKASYSSVIDILNSPQEREFFRKWFGDELHFPFPILMAFLAKGSELLGGILLCLGLFTRAAAALVAFTMFVATVTANLGENFNIDGGFTISYFLFALIIFIRGGGKFSLDQLIFRRNVTAPGSIHHFLR